MPEVFLELFCEEIPARMQAGAAADLARLVSAALAGLAPRDVAIFYGPRRIALSATVAPGIEAAASTERGPRAGAPEQALAGFLRKHGAARDALRAEGGYWVLDKRSEATPAASLIAAALPGLLRRFPWPKSMRWGGASHFVWVRPLRRIVCLLDGAVVPFDLRDGDDDGHGLASADLTEGHRFHAPSAFAVRSAADWAGQLAARRVLVDAAERKRRIASGLAAEAAARGLTLVDDPGLLDEVAGLVEWPVPLLGRIDPAFMDLPAEVMQVSMRVNQRYFALRDASDAAAPYFGFAANIEADDGGAAIVAGNERVLRARFADARHFWDLDRKTTLESRVPALDAITFHAKLGTQGARAGRIGALAGFLARDYFRVDEVLAGRAGILAKADLVTGMVGEFPELQGTMGRYYALHDGLPAALADAIRDHYAPKGPSDAVPSAPVSIAVALADKLDQLVGFFAIGERPTGSGDPYALRRAALGILRIVRENALRLPLRALIARAGAGYGAAIPAVPVEDVLGFMAERLRVQLRAEGARHDVLAAVFAASADDDLLRLLARTQAVAEMLGTAIGADLLAAYRRAANILRIEAQKDGPAEGAPDPALLAAPEEKALALALAGAARTLDAALAAEDFAAAMAALAGLRAALDAFFERVTVNAPEPELRRNRLRLLARVRDAMNRVADFSQIEG
ncbi:MAG: glycine--tRNA ligase subunit beta [Rhodospirillales bacterium]|nr:glycine--tRNA ligase subunit beta [Rhodospirillales bacterium]